jgi:hypothetical protein
MIADKLGLDALGLGLAYAAEFDGHGVLERMLKCWGSGREKNKGERGGRFERKEVGMREEEKGEKRRKISGVDAAGSRPIYYGRMDFFILI